MQVLEGAVLKKSKTSRDRRAGPSRVALVGLQIGAYGQNMKRKRPCEEEIIEMDEKKRKKQKERAGKERWIRTPDALERSSKTCSWPPECAWGGPSTSAARRTVEVRSRCELRKN